MKQEKKNRKKVLVFKWKFFQQKKTSSKNRYANCYVKNRRVGILSNIQDINLLKRPFCSNFFLRKEQESLHKLVSLQ